MVVKTYFPAHFFILPSSYQDQNTSYMRPLSTILLLLSGSFLFSQSTGLRVYQILQEKCATCHSNTNMEAGLDLEGQGTTLEARYMNVYNNLVGAAPSNSYADEKGYKRIFPGRPDKSFLFRKINKGLEPTVDMESQEQAAMPPYGSPELTDMEKEMIRQWILFGAPSAGEAVSEALISDFYMNDGLRSFPDGPPPAPDPSEGFQIKMGPFYMEPGGELEYFQKYQLDLPADVDVDRIEVDFSSFSHHFIIYNYETAGLADDIQPGFRLSQEHVNGIGIVTSVAEPTDLRLPQGTAYFWDKDIVLDLNAHYINYSVSQAYQAEVYVNIYTQPAGTATQEMHVNLVPNINIPIPNTGETVTHTASVVVPAEIWVWTLGGHTHRYGTGYKIWKRTSTGAKGELLYDGSCAQGIPGCVSPFFDYQHIPARVFEPLIPIDLNNGLIHEATWINDGPEGVAWGPTSEDEMMLFGLYYLTDTTGLGGIISDTETIRPTLEDIEVYPNPTSGHFNVRIPSYLNEMQFRLFDNLGREVRHLSIANGQTSTINTLELPKGVYFYRIEDSQSAQFRSGKLLLK